MLLILVTFVVSRLDRSSDSRLSQLANMLDISAIPDVSNLVKVIFSAPLNPLNGLALVFFSGLYSMIF